MKKILLIGVAVLALAGLATITPNAHAEPIYAPQTLGTWTSTGGAAGTNVAYVLDVRQQTSVTLQNTISGGSTTNGQIMAYTRSVDGSLYDPTVTFASLGTASGSFTNLAVQGCGYIKINYITNADAGSVVTNTLKYGIKIP